MLRPHVGRKQAVSEMAAVEASGSLAASRSSPSRGAHGRAGRKLLPGLGSTPFSSSSQAPVLLALPKVCRAAHPSEETKAGTSRAPWRGRVGADLTQPGRDRTPRACGRPRFCSRPHGLPTHPRIGSCVLPHLTRPSCSVPPRSIISRPFLCPSAVFLSPLVSTSLCPFRRKNLMLAA